MGKLMKAPNRPTGKNKGHIPILPPNDTAQADLLFLPDDNGFKYLLSYVDEARIADAVPLKSKLTKEVEKGFKTIFNRSKKKREELGIRSPLKPPSMLKVDDGSEFKGDVKKYFTKHNTYIRIGKVGRSKQQTLAEYLNYIIGRGVYIVQNANEINNNERDTEWTYLIPIIIKAYNDSNKKKKPDNKLKPPRCQDSECIL